MSGFTYYLATSSVRVTGTRVVVADPYSTEKAVRFDDLKVELVAGADTTVEVTLEVKRGGRDLDLAFTADGRLRSLSYKAVGAGAAIVGAGAKLVSFIGSVALAALGALSAPDGTTSDTPPDPRATWEAANSELLALLNSNRGLANSANTRLASLRNEVLAAPPSSLPALTAQISATQRVADAATAEVMRIEKQYAAWRDAQRSSVASEVATMIPITGLPQRTVEGVELPTPSSYLWEDFGVFVQVKDARRADAGARPTFDAGQADVVWWRQTREVELWVWKRDAAGIPVLVSIAPVRIVDWSSPLRRMELTSHAFGTHGGSIAFAEDGSPSTLSHNRESAWATLAASLGGVPDALAAGATQAKSLTDTIAGIADADDERLRTAAARDLEIAKNKQELAGVNATEEDYAELLRAEQKVKIRTAQRATSVSADALDNLKERVELAAQRNKLESDERAAVLATQLADLTAEVARIELEYRAKNPGGTAAAAGSG